MKDNLGWVWVFCWLVASCSSSGSLPCKSGNADLRCPRTDSIAPECPEADASLDQVPVCPSCEVCSEDACAPCSPDVSEQPLDGGGQEYCSLWSRDFSLDNFEVLTRFGFQRGLSVAEVDVQEVLEVNQQPFARVRVTAVDYGWSFIKDLEVLINLPTELVTPVVPGSRWLVSLTGHHPSDWSGYDLPVWSSTLVMVPESQRESVESALGYRHLLTSQVAVVKVAAQDENRTTFEVVDVLKGSLPSSFQDNWYFSWGLTYPAPTPEGQEPELYIASIQGLTYYQDQGLNLGTIIDFRPATAANLEVVNASLADPEARFPAEEWKKKRDRLRNSYLFNLSPLVVASMVTGTAEECCTGAGGTFVSHRISRILKGGSQIMRFITGGHAYYGSEVCGDGYFFGFREALPEDVYPEEEFGCLTYPTGSISEAWGPSITSVSNIVAKVSEVGQDEVTRWSLASPPVFQLFDADEEVPADWGLQDDPGPWSLPVDTLEGMLTASDFALFTVEEVSEDPAGRKTVLLETTLSLYEYDHIKRHHLKLSYFCGDPRLEQPGLRFIAPVVQGDPWIWNGEENQLDPHRVFLIPGVMWQEEWLTDNLRNAIFQALY